MVMCWMWGVRQRDESRMTPKMTPEQREEVNTFYLKEIKMWLGEGRLGAMMEIYWLEAWINFLEVMEIFYVFNLWLPCWIFTILHFIFHKLYLNTHTHTTRNYHLLIQEDWRIKRFTLKITHKWEWDPSGSCCNPRLFWGGPPISWGLCISLCFCTSITFLCLDNQQSKHQFVPFADFCDINIPSILYFKLQDISSYNTIKMQYNLEVVEWSSGEYRQQHR